MTESAQVAAMAATTSDVSAYEAKRLQRIQQNQQMLQSLGIATLQQPRKRRLQTRDLNIDDDNDPVSVAPLRRSSRLLQNEFFDPSAEPVALMVLESEPRRPRRPRVVPTAQPLDLPVVDETENPTTTPKRTKLSSLLLDIDMDAFHDRWLGKQIAPKGKQTIMQGMCPDHIPKFGKMSGIQSWKNAVALFVNVLGASGYDNIFSETPPVSSASSSEPAAVYFKWFAQHRMYDDSHVIQRLKRTQPGDTALWLEESKPPASEQLSNTTATSPVREPVLLFIRQVDGPYIYCGRLGYLGNVPEIRPLQFRWQLLDLKSLQWSKVKQLLEASHELADDAVIEDT